MWNRIYWAVFLVALAVTAFFAYYAYDWLRSIGAPGAALDGFYYYSFTGWIIVLLFSMALLVIANVILWIDRHAWAVWTTLLFFSILTLVWYLWLKPNARGFGMENGIATDISALTPFTGVIFCAAAAALAYFDQFLIVRLAQRMHPQTELTAEGAPLPQPEIVDENEGRPSSE